MHFANIDILYAVFFKKLKDSNKAIDVKNFSMLCASVLTK